MSYAITTTNSCLANWVTAIAWAEKGIQPRVVGDGGFKFAKIGSGGSFFNWGLIELGPDEMKRTKNSRYMHMVFNVQSGTVEVRVHENEFTVHKQGIWQVPRGMSYIPFIPLRLSHIVSIHPRTLFKPLFSTLASRASIGCVLRPLITPSTHVGIVHAITTSALYAQHRRTASGPVTMARPGQASSRGVSPSCHLQTERRLFAAVLQHPTLFSL